VVWKKKCPRKAANSSKKFQNTKQQRNTSVRLLIKRQRAREKEEEEREREREREREKEKNDSVTIKIITDSLITDEPFKFRVSELKVPPHNRSTHVIDVDGNRSRFVAHGIDNQSVIQDVPVIDIICVVCVFPVRVNELLRI